MEELKKRDGFKDEKMIIFPTETFANYLEHPMVKALFLTDIGFFPEAQYHFRERKDGAEEAILIYCIEGTGFIELENKKIELNAGMLFCIPPHTFHKYYADSKKPWSILWMHFKGENLPLLPIADLNIYTLDTVEENSQLQSHFMSLFNVMELPYTIGNMIYVSQLLSMIVSEIYFKERSSQVNVQNKYLTKAIHYMYENIHKELTLDELAIYMKLSKSYLNGIFKKHANRSPVDFFIHLKMQQACKYLKMTEMLIYEISKKLGYEDQYYFSRIFKKIIGVSPKEYRNKGIK